MAWHESQTWWDQIPQRIILRNTDVELISSQKFDPKNLDLNLDDLLDDTLVAVFFIICFKRIMNGKNDLSSWVWDEIQRRANQETYKAQGGFDMEALTLEEMVLRVERTQLNISILRGIEKIEKQLLFRELEDTPLTKYADSHSYVFDAYLKILKAMPDDEIAELAAVAETQLISWMPAIKEILTEAYDRSKAGNSW